MEGETTAKNQYLTVANLITALRLIGAVLLFFLEPLKLPFFLVYSFCGVSDVVDGFVARHTHTQSKFGAKLDSIADLTFYTAMLVRLLPILRETLPGWTWYVIFGVVAIRLAAYIVTALKFKKFSSRHTILNKATGCAVFFCPYILLFPKTVFLIYALVVCAIGAAGSLEELLVHLKRDRSEDIPSSKLRGK